MTTKSAYLSSALRMLFRTAIELGRPKDIILLDRSRALAHGLEVGIRDFRDRDGRLELQTAFGWIPARVGDKLVDTTGIIPSWEL